MTWVNVNRHGPENHLVTNTYFSPSTQALSRTIFWTGKQVSSIRGRSRCSLPHHSDPLQPLEISPFIGPVLTTDYPGLLGSVTQSRNVHTTLKDFQSRNTRSLLFSTFLPVYSCAGTVTFFNSPLLCLSYLSLWSRNPYGPSTWLEARKDKSRFCEVPDATLPGATRPATRYRPCRGPETCRPMHRVHRPPLLVLA